MIKRKCVLTLLGGHRLQAEIYLPRTGKPLFPNELERGLVREFIKRQPNMVNKVASIHILRN